MTGTTLAFTGAEYLPQAKITPVQAAKFRRAKSTGDTSENFLGTLSEGPLQVERIVGEARLGSRRDTQITRFARTGWWREGDSNPRDSLGFDGEIWPELGALFGPKRSIRAGENVFAWNSAPFR
ncbi:MAG TPA: hypothetical protein VII23_12795, partial [Terriglobales bacterium]